MTPDLIISWTVRLALICYAVSAALMLLQSPHPRIHATIRMLWTAGAILFIAHVAAAFHFTHHWSHTAAVLSTASETQKLLGLAFGEGIWFSYLFVLLWTADAAWSWLSYSAWQQRPPAATLALHAYLFFIAFNGAVIFESGPTRPLGILVTLLLALVWIRNRKPPIHRTRPGTHTDPGPAHADH